MIEEIEMYRTNDGQLHFSKKEAKKYIENKACEIVDNKLKEVRNKSLNLKQRDYIDIIITLVGNYDNLVKLVKELSNLVGD